MDKKRKLLEKIMRGEKTIESRWYKNKISPWNRIKPRDRVFFKNSGEPVSVQADVTKVMQYDNLDEASVRKIYKGFAKRLCLELDEDAFVKWVGENNKHYCILIFLEGVKSVRPFEINKKGFGSACAWLCVEDIKKIIK